MAYLTIDEYRAMGGSMDETAFNRHEMKARRLIDRLTHGRIRDESQIRDAVKMCMFELIRAQAEDESIAGGSGRAVTAISNDGISVSYAAQEGDAQGRYISIARSWLEGESTDAGVNLLYCGVDA